MTRKLVDLFTSSRHQPSVELSPEQWQELKDTEDRRILGNIVGVALEAPQMRVVLREAAQEVRSAPETDLQEQPRG